MRRDHQVVVFRDMGDAQAFGDAAHHGKIRLHDGDRPRLHQRREFDDALMMFAGGYWDRAVSRERRETVGIMRG